jgi:RimJ/RimL family protein N-acetyltransferase
MVENSGIVELDIWMAGSRNCGKGFGTHAINTLCNYLFKEFNCKAFILAPSARNSAAVKAYEKCGFVETKELPPNFIPDYFDSIVMEKKY